MFDNDFIKSSYFISTSISDFCQYLNEESAAMVTGIGMATVNLHTPGVYQYRVSDTPISVGGCSAIVNPTQKVSWNASFLQVSMKCRHRNLQLFPTNSVFFDAPVYSFLYSQWDLSYFTLFSAF